MFPAPPEPRRAVRKDIPRNLAIGIAAFLTLVITIPFFFSGSSASVSKRGDSWACCHSCCGWHGVLRVLRRGRGQLTAVCALLAALRSLPSRGSAGGRTKGTAWCVPNVPWRALAALAAAGPLEGHTHAGTRWRGLDSSLCRGLVRHRLQVVCCALRFRFRSTSQLRAVPYEPDAIPESMPFAIITDLDKRSHRTSDKKKPFWVASMKHGVLHYNAAKGSFRVEWVSDHEVQSKHSEEGRGMELSELVRYRNQMFTFDDRSGIVYELDNFDPRSSEDPAVFPRHILMEGDGRTDKGFKCEWATVKVSRAMLPGHGPRRVVLPAPLAFPGYAPCLRAPRARTARGGAHPNALCPGAVNGVWERLGLGSARHQCTICTVLASSQVLARYPRARPLRWLLRCRTTRCTSGPLGRSLLTLKGFGHPGSATCGSRLSTRSCASGMR